MVPAAALLQPEDLRGVKPERAAPELAPHLRPPRPCAAGGPSDALRSAAAAVHIVYSVPAAGGEPEHPTTLLELVMRFRDDGAAQYLAELRGELERCRTGPDGRRWALKDEPAVGEALLLTATEPARPTEAGAAGQVVPTLVARTGSAVVVLAGLGWESGNGDERLVRDLAPKAVERARGNI